MGCGYCGDDFSVTAADLVQNQVLPRGAMPILAAVTSTKDPLRAALIEAIVGHTQVDAGALAVAAQLDAKGPAMHGAVAQLLAGETSLGAGAMTLARNAALDTRLDAAIRASLLTTIGQIPGQPALDAATDVFARLNPMPGVPSAGAPPPAAGVDAVETAWRRYVGDRRRMTELDHFINIARTAPPAQRTLAYAVLLQSVRTQRTPPPIREKVVPVIEAAWSDPASAPSLVQAIGIMRLEAQYSEKLAAYNASRK